MEELGSYCAVVKASLKKISLERIRPYLQNSYVVTSGIIIVAGIY